MFFLFAVVGVLDRIANTFNLYWSANEFDSLVHFLAGAAVAFLFLWLYFYSGAFAPQKRNLKNFLIVSLLGAMFAAMLWEIYELVLGEAKTYRNTYIFDTTLDIIMDFLGAAGACLYGYLKEIKFQRLNIKSQNDTNEQN